MSDQDTQLNIEKQNEKLKKIVYDYIDIDDEIKEYNKIIKKLKEEKKEKETAILGFLETTKNKVLEVTNKGTNLRRNVYKTKAPLKKETMIESLNKLVNNKEKTTKLVEHIINDRPMVERVALKRTSNKNK